MKNTRIVQAWDTVSPTPAQKRRMRAALEVRLSGGRPETAAQNDCPDITTMNLIPPQSEKGRPREKPETKSKPRPRYQAVQTKKSLGSILLPIAAILAVVIAAGLFLGVMSGEQGSDPSFAAPGETKPATTATEAVKPTEPETLPEAYQEVVDTYVTAIEEGWNPAQCSEQGISILTANVESLEDLGYTLRDLDGDGSRELLMTDGDRIFDLFSLSPEGERILCVTGMDRIEYRLCMDGLISCVGSGSAARFSYTFYRFSNLTLDKIIEVIYDGERNEENPWFLGDNMQPITSQEAEKIIREDSPCVYLPFTALSGQAPLPEEALPEKAVLEQYAGTIASLREEDPNLGLYCFYDYDADGENELLLGTGRSIRRIVEKTGVVDSEIFFVSSSGYAYPCENHVMEQTAYGQGKSIIYYMQYGTESGILNLEYLYKDGDQWYSRNEEPISEEEVMAIRGKYKHLNLPWKNLYEFPVAISEDSGETRVSDLFKQVYLPFAREGKPVTREELENKLRENALSWKVREAIISCEDPENPGSGLGVPLADGGYLGNPMTYSLEGAVGRFVEAHLSEDGAQYRIGTNTFYLTYPADSVEELVSFLTGNEENILALKTAETFAQKYFAAAAEDMRKESNGSSDNKIHSYDLNYSIENMTGWENAADCYDRDGFVEVTAGALLSKGIGSYDYLTMQLQKENGAWTVTDSWLEK